VGNSKIKRRSEKRQNGKSLFSRTFQDLQRPNSRVYQDSKNEFSRPVSSPSPPSGKFEIWCNLRPQKSLQKCHIKYFPYCKHAVHLIMCKSYQGLDGDPARGDAGSKISRTTMLEFQDFSRVFRDPCLFQDSRSVQTMVSGSGISKTVSPTAVHAPWQRDFPQWLTPLYTCRSITATKRIVKTPDPLLDHRKHIRFSSP